MDAYLAPEQLCESILKIPSGTCADETLANLVDDVDDVDELILPWVIVSQSIAPIANGNA
jgi:hypothetical protein